VRHLERGKRKEARCLKDGKGEGEIYEGSFPPRAINFVVGRRSLLRVLFCFVFA
jgi:hypothetical protein